MGLLYLYFTATCFGSFLCLIQSCVRLYILYIYILLFIEHKGDVSPENYNSLLELLIY